MCYGVEAHIGTYTLPLLFAESSMTWNVNAGIEIFLVEGSAVILTFTACLNAI